MFYTIQSNSKQFLDFSTFWSVESLRDSKNPYFCHFGQIAIRYHFRGTKQGSKMTKIEIFFFESKKPIKCFQNLVRSYKKSYGRQRTSNDPLASFGPLSRQFLGQNRHYLLLLIDLQICGTYELSSHLIFYVEKTFISDTNIGITNN